MQRLSAPPHPAALAVRAWERGAPRLLVLLLQRQGDLRSFCPVTSTTTGHWDWCGAWVRRARAAPTPLYGRVRFETCTAAPQAHGNLFRLSHGSALRPGPGGATQIHRRGQRTAPRTTRYAQGLGDVCTTTLKSTELTEYSLRNWQLFSHFNGSTPSTQHPKEKRHVRE